MKLRFFVFAALLSTPFLANAQSEDQQVAEKRKLVQFSGVVVTGDSLAPVPFTNVLIKGSYRGTMGDIFGYFSFVAQTGDTIIFSALGFKRGNYIIPNNLSQSKYSMIHVMHEDTVLLDSVAVYPWPSKEQFKQAFIDLSLPDDEQIRAMRNLSNAELAQRLENLPTDGSLAFKYQQALHQTRLYEQGGTPQINLFNPIAWAQFIQAWKNGDFKKKRP